MGKDFTSYETTIHVHYYVVITLNNGSVNLDDTISMMVVSREVIEDHMLHEWSQKYPGRVTSVEVLGSWIGEENLQPGQTTMGLNYRRASREELGKWLIAVKNSPNPADSLQ